MSTIEEKIVIEETPVIEEETPVIEEETPVIEEEKQVVKEETPVIEEEKQVVKEETPVIEEEKQVVEEEKHIVEEEKHGVEEEKQKVKEEKHVVEEEKHVVKEEKHVVEEEKQKVKELITYFEKCVEENNINYMKKEEKQNIDIKQIEKQIETIEQNEKTPEQIILNVLEELKNPKIKLENDSVYENCIPEITDIYINKNVSSKNIENIYKEEYNQSNNRIDEDIESIKNDVGSQRKASVLVCGSLYLVGGVLALFQNSNN
jgi:hypothetical protein